MNWCDKSCAGANHPIPAVSGRLGEHTPPLRLPLTNIPRSQKSNHPTCSHPSCAHNDYTQNHGWGEQSTGKCGTQVCLLGWLMKLRKKIDTNTLVPKNVPPNSIDNVEDKGKGGCAKDRKPLQSKKKKVWGKEWTPSLSTKKATRLTGHFTAMHFMIQRASHRVISRERPGQVGQLSGTAAFEQGA